MPRPWQRKRPKKERKALAKKEKAASLNTSKDENTDTSPTEDAKVEKKPAANNSADGVFDVRKLMEELKAENAFVSKALSLVHIPKHKNQESHGSDSESDGEDGEPSEKKKSAQSGRAANASQLHEKLQAKLAELRGENFGQGKKKKKPKLTKAEKRAKSKAEKRLKQKLNKSLAVNGSPAGSPVSMSPNPHKPVYNNEGKMVFSKFDFANGEMVGKSSSSAPKGGAPGGGGGKPGPKDPKAALNKIKKHKEKLQSLEAIGKTERVKTIEEKTAWSTAMAKAEGVKVKDDVDLLKKSIKKIDQRKKKSKQKWEDRKESVEKRKDFKQKKRSENISKRKQDKKNNKMKKSGGKKAGFK